MEKLNKTKLIAIIIIALVIIAAIIIGIIFAKSGNNNNELENKAGSISSTASDFEALKVKNIELSYSEETKQTTLDFVIENVTDAKVEKSTIEIQLLDEKDGLIAGVETYVETIDVKGAHPVNMMLAGNIQGIKKIKLVNPMKEEVPAE
ncbi:MAG: hypothetical protein IJ272_03030 [Clostridia bacterium]|nr:hypothetical protein [Clostridia bacterium]